MELKGKVVKVIAGFYDIKEQNTHEIFRTRASGNLRKEEQNPLVGDFVLFEKGGFLKKILERKNFFVRPKIANVDQVIVVMSLTQPDFSSLLLDKFLMMIEYKKIVPILAITKNDLNTKNWNIFDLYKDYQVFIISKDDPQVIEQMKQIFQDKVSVFMGQTGVGKTTLLNRLSNSDFETQPISSALNRGKHTTRVVQMISWNGGELIDTPGFSSFDLDLDKNQMAKSFFVFQQNAPMCKFKNCLHYLEQLKECKIKLMVENKEIPLERYQNYLHWLKEVL